MKPGKSLPRGGKPIPHGRNQKGLASNGYIRTKNGEMKFIGGAAVARRAAVALGKGRGSRILRPGEKEEKKRGLPLGLSPFERFFAGLLRSETRDFLAEKKRDVWKVICKRMSLPAPDKKLPPSYDNQKLHFAHRACLVLEEARHAISQGLVNLQRRQAADSKKKNNRRCHNNNSDTMVLTLTNVQLKEKTGHSVLFFSKENRPFTPDEISSLRQGTVFACQNNKSNLARSVANMYLACVLPANRDEMIRSRSFSVMVFSQISPEPGTRWELTPITSLLSEQRKFDACTSAEIQKLPFLFPLLGMKGSTHTRFTQDECGNSIALEQVKSDDDSDAGEPSTHTENDASSMCDRAFNLKPLNKSQQKAASVFLNSGENTITLVQGPPGTGKTTLLVSVICRYVVQSIEENIGRTLMVCAPTNKAVSVLCTRFLESVVSERPCNVVLVGDDDKLLDDDTSRRGSLLRSVFLYTWVGTVLDDYSNLKSRLLRKGRKDFAYLANMSRQIQTRVHRSLGDSATSLLSKAVVDTMTDITAGLELGAGAMNDGSIRRLVELIDQVHSIIRTWKNEDVWPCLLGSSHIIFCTLASAGTSIIKKSILEVNDLIVDEAAASTEPEMYIPFIFRPKRLLAVGDPKQLPATVASHIAEELGMSRSLHERLMYDCGHKHILLDLQYRMKPELSRFPREAFYEGKLKNGSNVSRDEYQSGVKVLRGQQYSFLQVNGSERQAQSGSFENYAEAQKVVDIIQQIKQASHGTPGKWSSVDRVRIITFYQAQVSLIKRVLHQRRLGDVVVATVDSSQGCEADIVVISFVRSHGAAGRASVGFLSDDRRMNVAITRAKYQLICIGNAQRMLNLQNPKATTVKWLVQDAHERNCVIGLPREATGSTHPATKRERQKQKRDVEKLGTEAKDQKSDGGRTVKETAPDKKRRKGNNLSAQRVSTTDRCETNGVPVKTERSIEVEARASSKDESLHFGNEENVRIPISNAARGVDNEKEDIKSEYRDPRCKSVAASDGNEHNRKRHETSNAKVKEEDVCVFSVGSNDTSSDFEFDTRERSVAATAQELGLVDSDESTVISAASDDASEADFVDSRTRVFGVGEDSSCEMNPQDEDHFLVETTADKEVESSNESNEDRATETGMFMTVDI